MPKSLSQRLHKDAEKARKESVSRAKYTSLSRTLSDMVADLRLSAASGHFQTTLDIMQYAKEHSDTTGERLNMDVYYTVESAITAFLKHEEFDIVVHGTKIHVCW